MRGSPNRPPPEEAPMKPFRLSGCGVLTVLLCLSWSGAASAAAHVYLLRGIFNVSVGLDALAAKLGRIGIAASVYATPVRWRRSPPRATATAPRARSS